jgi:Zn-dependent protease/CBS domain-containing protein
MPGSFYLGTIAGIRLTAHYSWLIILAVFTVSLATGWFPQALPGLSAATYWLTGFVAALLLFASVLAHELAHSLVARARGVPVKHIMLYFFGGSSNLEEEPRSPGVEFQITIAGPLTNFLLGALAWLAHGLLLTSAPLVAAVFGYLAVMNVVLIVFNLIPGFPLDGGRVLRSILWKLTGSMRTATRWSAQVGQYVAFLFILIGIWLAFTGDLLSGLWLGLIGWFLLTAARAARARAAQETFVQHVQNLQDIPIEKAMSPVPLVVSPGMAVQDLVDIYVLPRKLSAVPVMAGERLVGVVTLTDIQQVPREDWARVVVGQIMTPWDRVPTASPQQPLHEALTLLDEHDGNYLFVMQDGRLVGMVSRDAAVRLMEIRQSLGLTGTEAYPTDYLRKAS